MFREMSSCCGPRKPYGIVSGTAKQTLQRVNVQER
jgi:hypothetical protein